MSYIAKIKFSDTTYNIKAATVDCTDITEGYVLTASSSGVGVWAPGGSGGGVTSIGGATGAITLGTGMGINSQTLSCEGFNYTATEPTATPTTGGVQVAILSSAPTTYYSGWIYCILEPESTT